MSGSLSPEEMADLSPEEVAAAQMIADQVNAGGDIQSLMASNPEMMQGLMAKLGGMEGMSSDYLEGLPKQVIRRVKALKQLQADAVALEVAYQREIQKLDRLYAPQFDAVYAKRSLIVKGEYEPTDEESVWAEDEEDEEDKVEDPDEAEEPTTGIPDFWLGCLSNNELTERKIEPHDVEILKAMVNIEMEYSGEGSEEDFFLLKFTFAPNEFFTNTELTKTYFVDVAAEEGELMYGGPSYKRAEGCKIDWKPNMNPTIKKVTKTQRKKGGTGKGAKRTIVKEVKQESFFTFFSPPAPPPDDIPEDGDTEELAQLHAELFEDFELADTFKEKIVPSAVLWFTGEALDYDEDGGEDDDEDGYGEDGGLDELDDDDDDDDADPNYKPPEDAPECKQQ
jgi:nucleosome assembly protein 1-like 1